MAPVCVQKSVRGRVCWGLLFGQCTHPICMSLILNDVQAWGSVCVCDGEDACVPSWSDQSERTRFFFFPVAFLTAANC